MQVCVVVSIVVSTSMQVCVVVSILIKVCIDACNYAMEYASVCKYVCNNTGRLVRYSNLLLILVLVSPLVQKFWLSQVIRTTWDWLGEDLITTWVRIPIESGYHLSLVTIWLWLPLKFGYQLGQVTFETGYHMILLPPDCQLSLVSNWVWLPLKFNKLSKKVSGARIC